MVVCPVRRLRDALEIGLARQALERDCNTRFHVQVGRHILNSMSNEVVNMVAVYLRYCLVKYG